jgi:hypothetical protein
MQESEIEKYLVEQVKGIGGRAYKFVSPGNNGVPDRLVVLPGAVIIFVELKALHGKLTPLQVGQITRLKGFGCSVLVIKSKPEVDDFIAFCKLQMARAVKLQAIQLSMQI